MAVFQAEYDAKFEVPEKHGEDVFNDLLGGLFYIISWFQYKSRQAEMQDSCIVTAPPTYPTNEKSPPIKGGE